MKRNIRIHTSTIPPFPAVSKANKRILKYNTAKILNTKQIRIKKIIF